MPVIEECVTVAAPVAHVWTFMTNPDNFPTYSSFATECEQVAGNGVEPGACYRFVVNAVNRRMEFTSQTVEVEEGKRILSKCSDGPIPYTLELRFEKTEGGTTVHWRQEANSYGGMVRLLWEPVVTKIYAKNIRSDLESAKTLMETLPQT